MAVRATIPRWAPKRTHSLVLASAGFAALLLAPSLARAQTLGSAESFAILGGSSATAAGTGSIIIGDVGVSPGTSMTGFDGTSATIVPPFSMHIEDGQAIAAQASVGTLYTLLADAGPCSPLAAQLDGLTVGPGVYCFSSTADLAATGNLTLDGAGLYIFQVGSSLTANVLSSVTLLNGADPCNVFWQVTSAATLNGVDFVGNVVAQAGVTLGDGATLLGRALTTAAGAVTIAGSNTVGGCAVGATSTPGPTPTATAGATPAPTDAPTPAVTATAGPTPAPTDVPVPTSTPVATETPTPSGAPTVTPAPTETPAPSAAPTLTPAPTRTPTPSAAPTPVVTPTALPTPVPSGAPTPNPTPTEVCHHVCADMLRLAPDGSDKLDLLVVRSAFPSGAAIDVDDAFSIVLRNADGIVYSAALQPGDLVRRGKRLYFSDRSAGGGIRGGLRLVKIEEVAARDGGTRITVQAEADLSSATSATMTIEIRAGEHFNSITDTWRKKSFGWFRPHR